ncbi:MAG TPA: alpha/beta hydrolase [Candidatus Paceibacterota bacterium]|nr:alpha/beta hydrolase [Candidatus Paceibacterota bacterium]
MKPRIIYIHGNGASHWSFAWAKWFKEELEKAGYEIFFETMPDSVIARKQYWLPFLEEHVKAGKDDVIVGWSSGATATMRYAETHKLRGSVLIGPSSSDLGDELEKQSGYFDGPWQWQKIKENNGHIALIYSNDDPFIPQEQFEIVTHELTPEVIMVPTRKHFIDDTTFPELLEHIVKTYPTQ